MSIVGIGVCVGFLLITGMGMIAVMNSAKTQSNRGRND